MATLSSATSASASAPGPAKPWGLAAAFVALIAVMALPTPATLPYAGQIVLGLLLFSVILWMTEAVDYAVSAVLITTLLALLLGFAPDAAKGEPLSARALRSGSPWEGSRIPRWRWLRQPLFFQRV